MTTTAASFTKSARSPRAWNVSLWVGQALLAALFAMAGFMKSTLPIDELVQKMVWPGAMPAALVRFIGVSELAGAIGLILPALTRIRPQLTAVAAAGIAVIMLLASLFHLTRGEFQVLPMNMALGSLAAFVAWGRHRKAPIVPR